MPPPSPQTAAASNAAAKLAFLRRPASYPDAPRTVTCIETHYAWVFLSQRFAYKLKKPVRTMWFDYTTVDARHADACREVTLNRRLAPAVYLGVVPLSVGRDGALALDDTGTVVDWLVKMRRLQPQHMLDYALRHHQVNEDGIEALAELLAQFWARQAPESLSADEHLTRLDNAVADNVAYLIDNTPCEGAYVPAIGSRLRDYLLRQRSLFEQRVGDARVKELHGDLRPEHVCLSRPPVVIDCLQFSHALRVLDVAEELAFLVLECEKLGGGGWIEARILRRYADVSHDRPPESLLDFYKGFRALLRAKLAAGHLADGSATDPGHWLSTATVYLDYAHTYATHALRIVR